MENDAWCISFFDPFMAKLPQLQGYIRSSALKPDSAYQVTEIEKVDWTMFLVRRLF